MRKLLQNLRQSQLSHLFSFRSPEPPPRAELNPPRFDDDGIFTIDGSLYRGADDLPDIRGQLHLFNETIHFIPERLEFNPIPVGLLLHIHHHMMPHPSAMESGDDPLAPNSLYLFGIVWLDDKDELESAQTVYFSGRKSDLDQLRDLAEKAIAEAQSRRNYTPPSLSDLPALPSQKQIQVDATAPEVLPLAVRQRMAVPLIDIKISGRPSKIIDERYIPEIRKRLPRRNRNGDWQLLFQLSTDGCSCHTMYEKVAGRWPLVLAVKTDMDDRIGAFISSELKVTRGFTGQPDFFVWRIRETIEMFGGLGPPANRFFVACGLDEIKIGGGDGTAIYMGGMLQIGTSQACMTYGSPMLTQKERFSIMDVEVWLISRA